MNRLLPAVLVVITSCAMSRPSAELPPLVFTATDAEKQAAQPLLDDHFIRDRSGGVSEDHLKEILAAPVFLWITKKWYSGPPKLRRGMMAATPIVSAKPEPEPEPE